MASAPLNEPPTINIPLAMASAPFKSDDKKIISTHPIADIVNVYRHRLPKGSFNQDIGEDVKDELIEFVGVLHNTKPARLIRLTDSRENLAMRLRRMVDEWMEQATFTDTVRSHCSSLLETIANGATDLDIWTVVADLVTAFDSSKLSPGFNESDATVTISSKVAGYLKKDWTSTFVGDSLRALQGCIRKWECQTPDEFYARTLVFLQSSGMGKSRLADAFGQGCPMISYVLRDKDAMGFPPADKEILSFMLEHPSKHQKDRLIISPSKKDPKKKTDITWYHSLAVGLLQASFEVLNTWVEERSRAGMRLNDLAALRHTEMAYNSESEETVDTSKRTEFCESVATKARKIADDLIQKSTWRRVFNIDEGSAIRRELIDKENHHLDDLLIAAQKLTDNLGKFPSENMNDPPLVVVFDEASSLLKEGGGIRSGRYVALNRIMSCLKNYRIWFFIISTESQVGTILPLDNAERTNDYVENPALRDADGLETQLKRIPPFLALQLDVEDTRRMQDSIEDELRKSLSDFEKPEHMAMFGRRLWYAYVDNPEQMNNLAKLKLIAGVRKGVYKAYDVDHVFAALSFRLSLDACLHNVKAIPLVRTAINSHMRVVNSIDLDTGTLVTSTPSEPILAKAAMEHLCSGSGSNWPVSIETLVKELLQKGLVEKGLKGELYARLVVILARDWVRDCQWHRVSDEELRQNANSDGEIHQGADSDGGMHQESNPDFRSKNMKSFTVREFLMALYAKQGHESIMEIDQKILDARMNFTHFTLTQANLCDEILSDLFIDLLRRGAALQLAPVQPTYDILIPIYLGKEDEALEPSKCSCIVIQVKNRVEPTTPKAILNEKFTMVRNRNRNRKPGVSKTASTKARKDEASESPSAKAKARKSSRIASTKKGKASESPSTKARTQKASEIASTKAKEETSESKEEKGPKAKLVFGKVKNPILFLLFDFGGARTENSIAPSVEVSYSSNIENVPFVWVIHSRGHDHKVFGCLVHMRCENAGRMFFATAVPGDSEEDQIVRRNTAFFKLERSFRVPEKRKTENKDEDKYMDMDMNGDEDEDMDDEDEDMDDEDEDTDDEDEDTDMGEC